MLSPKRVKFRKMFKGRTKGLAPAWQRGVVRHLRAAGAGAGLGDQPADRGGACRADAPHQARRQGVDPDLPGQADHEEAGRDAHGKGKGSPEMWVAVVKPGRVMFELEGVTPRDRAEGDGARGGEDAGEDQVRRARGGAYRCELTRFASCRTRRSRRGSRSSRRSASACRFRSATEPLEDPLRLRAIRRDIARLKTVLRERELDERALSAGGMTHG